MCPDWLQELNLELQMVMNELGMVTTSTGTVREPWVTLTSTVNIERILVGIIISAVLGREP